MNNTILKNSRNEGFLLYSMPIVSGSVKPGVPVVLSFGNNGITTVNNSQTSSLKVLFVAKEPEFSRNGNGINQTISSTDEDPTVEFARIKSGDQFMALVRSGTTVNLGTTLMAQSTGFTNFVDSDPRDQFAPIFSLEELGVLGSDTLVLCQAK